MMASEKYKAIDTPGQSPLVNEPRATQGQTEDEKKLGGREAPANGENKNQEGSKEGQSKRNLNSLRKVTANLVGASEKKTLVMEHENGERDSIDVLLGKGKNNFSGEGGRLKIKFLDFFTTRMYITDLDQQVIVANDKLGQVSVYEEPAPQQKDNDKEKGKSPMTDENTTMLDSTSRGRVPLRRNTTMNVNPKGEVKVEVRIQTLGELEDFKDFQNKLQPLLILRFELSLAGHTWQ